MESQLVKTLHMSRIKRRQIAHENERQQQQQQKKEGMKQRGVGRGKGGSCRKTTTIFANKSELCLPGAAKTAVTDELKSS